MILKARASFILTVAVVLFSCAVTPPLAAGQPGSPAAKAAAAKAATEKAAAEKKAADEKAEAEKKAADAKTADDKAKADAEKAEAEFKVSLKDNPLEVAGVEPFVAKEDKGEVGDPKKLGKAGMGDRLRIIIPRLADAAKYKVIEPAKLVLFIDGRVFKEVYPESVIGDSVVYKLERTPAGLDKTPAALDAWNDLLGSPRWDSIKPVVVSVGYENQDPLRVAKAYEKKPNLNLIVYRKLWAGISLLGLIVLVWLFMKYGRTTLLLDSGPPNPPKGKDRPYSLAKVQVAWWFFLVVGCFILIYLITGEFTMTEQALTLIGIGTGTALGSAMIDASKRNSADSELGTLNPQKARLETEIAELKKEKVGIETAVATNPGATDTQKASLKADQESLKAKNIELAGKQEELKAVGARIDDANAGMEKPVSEGWWSDLVTDASGPSFHRFQMIAWTVILGVLFLASVYKSLSMPVFSATMLALMGISAGTYLGFKIPEQQNKPEESVAGAEAGAAVAGAVTPGLVADEAETIDGCDVDIVDETPDEDLPVTEGGVK